MDFNPPPAKRRKIEENHGETMEVDQDEGIDYSLFLKPKQTTKPRVGQNFQATIPPFNPKPILAEEGHKQANEPQISPSTSNAAPDDDEIDYSQFMKPKIPTQPRVGSSFQACIPNLQSNYLGVGSLSTSLEQPMPSPMPDQRHPIDFGSGAPVDRASLSRLISFMIPTPEERLKGIKSNLPPEFAHYSDDDLLEFFPFCIKPPKTSRVGEDFQAMQIPAVVSDYSISDPARVGLPAADPFANLEELKRQRDERRKKAEKEMEEEGPEEESQKWNLQTLYNMEFNDEEDEEDEVFDVGETGLMVAVIDKRMDWIPGDEEKDAREEVLVQFKDGRREWKYPEELGDSEHLIDQYEEDNGLDEEVFVTPASELEANDESGHSTSGEGLTLSEEEAFKAPTSLENKPEEIPEKPRVMPEIAPLEPIPFQHPSLSVSQVRSFPSELIPKQTVSDGNLTPQPNPIPAFGDSGWSANVTNLE